uniref:Uncharacterized protein n=1 Tax=Arion vulgaris TaxID=1028688 RepID=A0A0B6YCC1_9EUPU
MKRNKPPAMLINQNLQADGWLCWGNQQCVEGLHRDPRDGISHKNINQKSVSAETQ